MEMVHLIIGRWRDVGAVEYRTYEKLQDELAFNNSYARVHKQKKARVKYVELPRKIYVLTYL